MPRSLPASDHDLWHAPTLLCSTDSAGSSAFAGPPPFASAIPFLPRGARRSYSNRYHFIDEAIVAGARKALSEAGCELVLHDRVIATRAEARDCLGGFRKVDDLYAVVLFSGTGVWAAHLAGALRDFAGSGRGIVLWTNPGSQGWRPVGGLIMHGTLQEEELVGGRICTMREQVRREIYEYLEVSFKRRRLHHYLGYVTPAEFKCAASRDAAR